MFESVTVKNFRCFRDFTLEPLERMNLIAGVNNVGKTALLEAVWLYHGHHNPEVGLRLSAFRGLGPFKKQEFMWDLFLKFDPKKIINISIRDPNNVSSILSARILEHPISQLSLTDLERKTINSQESSVKEMTTRESTEPIESEVLFEHLNGSGEVTKAHAYVEQDRIRFERAPQAKVSKSIYLGSRIHESLETLAERYGNLQVKKKEKEIVNILRIIEPSLKRLTVRYGGGAPVIYGDIGIKRLMPLLLMGEGMARLLGIGLAITDAENGTLLIDEIENGLHYSVMTNIWKAVANLARMYSVQIFATTHSRECIQAAHEAFRESERYDFLLHRLDWVNGEIQAVTYDQEALEAALKAKLEVR